METLFDRNKRLLRLTSTKYVRSIMNAINWEKQLIAIRGVRGIGKTTLMLQHQKLNYGFDNRTALYIKLDSTYFHTHSLTELAETFYQSGGTRLYIDEVHKYPHWSREIKDIYDYLPELKVVISGSSLLDIINADADLSRRCKSYNMSVWSYREFLNLRYGIELPIFAFDDIIHNASDICVSVNDKIRPLQYFNEYLCSGCYPLKNDGIDDYQSQLTNIVDMILSIELPLLRGVDVGNVRKLKTLLVIMSNDVPMLVDISKLATLTSLSRPTVLGYLQNLADAGLIRLLYSDESSLKKMQKPDKIFLGDTNLMFALATQVPNTGSLRETFFCNQAAGAGLRTEYSKSKGDFLLDGTYTFEVGGSKKDGKQVASLDNAFIAADGIEYTFGNKLPLWLFGLMY